MAPELSSSPSDTPRLWRADLLQQYEAQLRTLRASNFPDRDLEAFLMTHINILSPVSGERPAPSDKIVDLDHQRLKAEAHARIEALRSQSTLHCLAKVQEAHRIRHQYRESFKKIAA